MSDPGWIVFLSRALHADKDIVTSQTNRQRSIGGWRVQLELLHQEVVRLDGDVCFCITYDYFSVLHWLLCSRKRTCHLSGHFSVAKYYFCRKSDLARVMR